jgi:hypothetical protein
MEIINGPYLQNVTKHSITVMWHTDRPATSAVEYEASKRLGWSAYVGRPEPTCGLRKEDTALRTIHAITLDGLDEEWLYYYRVRSVDGDGDEVVSEGASFRTAAKDASPFRFATYGDDHGIAEAHKRNADLARGYRADICVGTGDAAQDVIEEYREGFFACTHELLKYASWFATMGNHDSPNEGYFQYFSYPEPRYWFSFNYGCAHFTILNTNLDYRPGSEQWVWLERDLKTFREARWKFVLFHHPPFCSNNCEIVKTRVLCPLFEKYGVDIVLNAHATIYERFHPLSGGQYDSDRGLVYFVSGGGGYDMSRTPSELWDHVHPFSAFIRPVNHFLLTSVAPDECGVRAIDNEDRVFDTLTLTKPSSELAPMPAAGLQLPYPHPPDPGTVVAGLAEAPVRWVLPRPQHGIDAEMTRSGNNSIRWTNDGNEPVFPALRRVLVEDGTAREAVAGKAYEVSAWVKTEDVTGGATVSFSYNGDMGFLGRVTSDPISGTRDWTRVTVQVPPVPRHVYFCRVLLSAQPGSTGTAWFDDVEVKEIG